MTRGVNAKEIYQLATQEMGPFTPSTETFNTAVPVKKRQQKESTQQESKAGLQQ
jgi:hypothetical protein